MFQVFRVINAVCDSCSQFCVGTAETINGLFLVAYITGVEQTGKLLENTNLHGIGILELVDKEMSIARCDVLLHFLNVKQVQEHHFHIIEVY